MIITNSRNGRVDEDNAQVAPPIANKQRKKTTTRRNQSPPYPCPYPCPYTRPYPFPNTCPRPRPYTYGTVVAWLACHWHTSCFLTVNQLIV